MSTREEMNTKLKSEQQFIMDECIHFLDDLQYEMEKRNKPHFEYMVSDAREMAKFFHRLTDDLKRLKKQRKEQEKHEHE